MALELLGRGPGARTVEVVGGSLRLEEARVAFGPLYLCATKSAQSELCGTALAEYLDTQTVNALDPDDQMLGALDATTGTVRGGFFDYGITWLLTAPTPRANAGAVAGHSARLRFSAAAAGVPAVDVEVNVDIVPLAPGDAAMNGQKTSHEIERSGEQLTVSIDPNSWLERIRLDELLALDTDGDRKVRLTADTQAYEAIVQGMTVNAPPRLLWQE